MIDAVVLEKQSLVVDGQTGTHCWGHQSKVASWGCWSNLPVRKAIAVEKRDARLGLIHSVHFDRIDLFVSLMSIQVVHRIATGAYHEAGAGYPFPVSFCLASIDPYCRQ